MRISNRDWIAWSILAAIMVVAAGAYYAQLQPRAGDGVPVYKIVVTPSGA
jgi:hypothetical protein